MLFSFRGTETLFSIQFSIHPWNGHCVLYLVLEHRFLAPFSSRAETSCSVFRPGTGHYVLYFVLEQRIVAPFSSRAETICSIQFWNGDFLLWLVLKRRLFALFSSGTESDNFKTTAKR